MIYRVWHWNGTRDNVQLTGNSSTVRHIVFSPDGSRVATAGYAGHVKVYNSSSHRLINDIVAQPAATNFGTIAFFPDGVHLLTCGADSWVRIWDTDARPARSLLSVFNGTDAPISQFFVGSTARAALSPDGNTLYATNGFGWLNSFAPITLEQWDLHDLKNPRKVGDFPSTPGIYMAYNLRLVPSLNRLITVNSSVYGGNNALSAQIYDAGTSPPTPLNILDDGGLDHRDLDVSPDNTLLALSTWEGTVSLWDWQHNKRVATLDVNPGRAESCIVSSVRFHPKLPIVVTACHDSRVTLFSTTTYRELAVIDIDEDRQLSFGPHGALKEAVFSPDGKTLAIGAGDDLWLIDLNFFDPQIDALAKERPAFTHE
jgi:WD40 repeat protein